MANPYEDLLAKGSTQVAADANPYDALVKQDIASRAKSSVSQSASLNPDSDAEAQRLARTYGVPVAAARLKQPELQTRAKVDAIDYDALIQDSPMTAKFVADPDKAAISYDDTANMGAIETSLSKLTNAAKSFYIGLNPQSNAAIYGGLETASALTGADYAQDFYRGLRKGQEGRVKNIRSTMTPMGEIEQGVNSGFQSLGSMLPATLLSVATGNPLPALASAGITTGGQASAEALDRGLSPGRAALFGGSQAAIEIATEKFPIAKLIGDTKASAPFLKKLMGQAVREVPGELMATTLQNFNEWAVLNNDKPFSEYLKALPADLGQTVIATLTATGAQTGIIHAMSKATAKTREAEAVEQNGQNLEQMNQLLAASKVLPRDAESFRQFIDRAAAEGVQDIYINPESLAQSGVDLTALAAISPSVREQIQGATATGEDIKIPLGEYAVNIGPTDLAQALSDHIKTDPNGMTRPEAQAFIEGQQENLQAEIDKVMGEREADDSFKESRKVVHDDVLKQLGEANRFTEDANKPYATMMSNFYSVQAARLGITPEEMYAKYPVKIQSGSTDKGAVLDRVNQNDEVNQGLPPNGNRRFSEDQRTAALGDSRVKRGLKLGKKTRIWRGVSKVEGDGMATYGLGSYTTTDRNTARKYAGTDGEVVEMGASDLPENPLRFESVQDFQIWYGQVLKTLGMTSKRDVATEFSDYADFIRAIAPEADGIQIGNGEIIVKYPDPSGALDQMDGVKRGSFSPSTSTITLLQAADLSTFLHESGHFYLETLNKMALDPNAPQEIKDDMDATLKWFGVPDIETWNGYSVDQYREYHEQFARGFEAYLFEGKAPSVEMRGVFERFASWLKRIYADIRNLDVELSDEVRQVFDRLLATAEQIKEAEAARNFEPVFQTAEEAGMTPEQYEDYVRLGIAATQESLDKLQLRSLRDMKWLSNAKGKALKDLQKQADTKRKAIKEEVTEEVLSEPINQARSFLKRGEFVVPEGASKAQRRSITEIGLEGNTKLSLPILKEMYGETGNAIWRNLPTGQYGLVSTDGLHPDMVAEMFGFQSGDELVRALLEQENSKDKIAGLTDQRMLERYGDLVDEGAVERAAEKAIHNEARLKFVATEMAALLQQMGSVQELQRLAKTAAQSAMSQVKVKEINPNRYIAAGVRAGKAADKAIKSGDRQEAIRLKRLQLFHVAMTKEAIEANANTEKSLVKFRKLFRSDKRLAKTYDTKLVAAAKAVLGAYGIGGQVNAAQALEDLKRVKEYDPELHEQIEPLMNAALRGAADYKELSYGDFKSMLDAVAQIAHAAKRTKQVRIDGQLIDKKVVLDDLRKRLNEIGIPDTKPGDLEAVTDAERRQWTVQGLQAYMRRVESWADAMDGGNFDGPFRKYIWQPMSTAITNYRTAKNKVLKKYVMLLRDKQKEFNNAKIAAPELGYTFTEKSQLLGALLHIGNDSNKRKLLLGRGWATERATEAGEKVLETARFDTFLNRLIAEGTLVQSDFDFLQSVWDLMESIKPDAQKAHYDMYGYYFNEITADTINTPWGQYKGGYAPAKADSDIVQDAALKNEANAIEEGFNYMMPSTATGFTKSRTEYNKPLVMDLRLVAAHIDQALRFTYVQPTVRDTLRIIRSNSFTSPMQKLDSSVITDMLMPWLHRSASQLSSMPFTGKGGKAVDKFWKALRARTGMVTMTANFVNAFQQLSGLTMAAVKVKPRYLKNALTTYIKAPTDTAAEISELSPWMADRLSGQSFELRTELNQILEDESGWQKVKDMSSRHAYFVQRAFQNVVDIVSWQGAFDEVSGTMTVKQAVQYADSIVRQTQGSQSPEDIARFEAGDSFKQLFTQFTGYFNMQANLLATEYKKATRDLGGDRGRLTYVYVMGMMMPALIADAIVRTFGWDWDDDDDDGYSDEFFAWFFGSQLRAGVAMFPFVGSLLNATANRFNQQPYDDRLTTSPAVSTVESSLGAPFSVYKAVTGEGKASRAISDTLTLMTMLTGVPFSAVSRPLKYAADVSEGKAEPANPADAVRGAVSGKGREEERKR